jgi:hypothetical protein
MARSKTHRKAQEETERPVKKLQMTFLVSPTVRERLEHLHQISECETMTEVFRRAIVLYEDLLTLQQKGGRILVEEKRGEPPMALRLM